jgi:DMSO/TMAO reductase YedYZ molybdopterin-dependent catalytic subunit
MPRVLRAARSRAGRRRPSGRTAPRQLVVRDEPRNVETAAHALGAYLTSAADRFLRSNFAVPQLPRRAHRLHVGGLVDRPLRLDVEELSLLPQRTLTVTTECAGNHRTTFSPLPSGEPWSGGAVSTARWTGVALATLLDRAGVRPGALEVVATGADSGQVATGRVPYARSLPLARALHPDTLLALRMNGEPLLAAHGAPMRLVVPGWYGMASVKWLAGIEVVAEPFAGYFQSERYVYREPGGRALPVTDMRVKSVFTSPQAAVPVEMGAVRVSGFAWSGNARIARVEVACGGGGEWALARLTGEDEPYAWRAWELIWTPAWRGRHVLRCRATDEAGNVQPDLPRWNELGYGANGAQSLIVEVF